MLIAPQVFDDIAHAGSNLSVDATSVPSNRLPAIARLWETASGTLTIRNAGTLPPALLAGIARALGPRVTFVES